jgi:predicted PurR-regulated permease PerM
MGEAIGRDRQTAKVLLTILVLALALAIVYVARTVFVVFVFSILFAYLIDPVCGFCSAILYSSRICEARIFWRPTSHF